MSSLSPGDAWRRRWGCWGFVERAAGGPLSHTLQCVVLTGIPILEANTTVSAEASSIVNPLWRRRRKEEDEEGGGRGERKGSGGGEGAKRHSSL